MDFTHSAQAMVEAIAPIVSGRTVNIMNTDAIIIASSEKNRIGTFHKGAAEVIKKRGPVWIYKKDVARYPGAKEGINLPIITDGRLVGVVGIYGDPDSVKDVANLLCVYVRQYFTTMALASAENMRDRLRTELMRMLVHGSYTQNAEQMCMALGISVKMPARAVVVSLNSRETDVINKGESLDKIADVLIAAGYIVPEHDIYGVIDEVFICFKADEHIADFCDFLEDVRAKLVSVLDGDISVASGESCGSLSELSSSAYEAKLMAGSCSGVCCMDDNRARIDFVFNSLLENTQVRFPDKIYREFVRHFGARSAEKLLDTLQAYSACNENVTLTAHKLNIHRNTLLYRMRVILNALGLTESDTFTKNFFLNLLLSCHSHTEKKQIHK